MDHENSLECLSANAGKQTKKLGEKKASRRKAEKKEPESRGLWIQKRNTGEERKAMDAKSRKKWPESRRRWVNLLGVGGGDAIAETIGGNGILERRGGGGRVGLVMNGEEDGSYYGGIQCLCALEKDN